MKLRGIKGLEKMSWELFRGTVQGAPVESLPGISGRGKSTVSRPELFSDWRSKDRRERAQLAVARTYFDYAIAGFSV